MEEVLGVIAEAVGEVLSVIVEALGLRAIIVLIAMLLIIGAIVYFN